MHGVGPGTLLGGRYAVTLRTSEASSHERWRASDHTLEREVVLVCFPASSPIAPPTLDAARRAAGVEDPRLVRVLDVGTDQGVAFVVEEPLTGAVPLSHLLQSGGLPADEVRRLTGETASALDKASHRGLHHLALTPSAVLRMPDGSVKVRGLATEAVLTGADRISDEHASRADAVGLVKVAYAGLTARWPAVSVDGGLVGPGPASGTGLEDAPTVVGGVAAPSEIVTGVPNDLDLICRMTLGDSQRGPISPGDLALQIAPWPSGPPQSDGASGIGLPASRERSRSTRVPAGRRRCRARRGWRRGCGRCGSGVRRPHRRLPQRSSPDGERRRVLRRRPGGGGAAGGCWSRSSRRGRRRGRRCGAASPLRVPRPQGLPLPSATGSAPSPVPPPTRPPPEPQSAAPRMPPTTTTTTTTVRRSPSPMPSTRPPRPRSSRRCRSSDATLPSVPRGAQSRIALAIVGVLVLVALFIGINNVAKIGQSDGDPAANAVVTVTATRSQSSAPPETTSEPAPTSTSAPPTTPVSITGGKGYDEQDGNEADQNVKNVFDGDPSTGWRSRWYGTPTYNGGKDGLGVILELSQPTAVSEVELVLPAKQDVTVYLTNGTLPRGRPAGRVGQGRRGHRDHQGRRRSSSPARHSSSSSPGPRRPRSRPTTAPRSTK